MVRIDAANTSQFRGVGATLTAASHQRAEATPRALPSVRRGRPARSIDRLLSDYNNRTSAAWG